MLKVNEKLFIKDYKQLKTDIRLIKTLLKFPAFRYPWCRKRKIEYLTDEKLQRDLLMNQDELKNMERYILR